MKAFWVICIALALLLGACGKRGPLLLPEGTESLPKDPSERENAPL